LAGKENIKELCETPTFNKLVEKGNEKNTIFEVIE